MHTPGYFIYRQDGQFILYDIVGQRYFELENSNLDFLDKDPGAQLTTSIPISWGGDLLSHIAHQGSRISSELTEKLSEEDLVAAYTELSQNAGDIPEKDLPSGDIISLPNPSLDDFNVSLKDCFLKRKTTREFLPKNITLRALSDILYACFAPIHGKENIELQKKNIKDVMQRRSSPSATGLASCDAILWVNNLEGLSAGIYSYDDQNHTLIKHQSSMSEAELEYGLLDQFWIQNLAAGIFIVNDLRRTWVKDIECRGYVSSYLEAGHLSQNILLAATALGLETFISGAFRDDVLNEKLNLPSYRFASLFIGLGHGTGSILPQRYIDHMKD